MSRDGKQVEPLEPIESLLVEWREADQNGVFARTRLDLSAAMADPEPVMFSPGVHDDSIPRFWAYRRYAVAAAILMAVGLGTLFFAMELRTVRERQAYFAAEERGDGSVAVGQPSDPLLAGERPRVGCLSGPALARADDCDGVDFDGDGDVDLADIGRLQLSLAVAARTR